MNTPLWKVEPVTEHKDGKFYAGTALHIQGEEKRRDFVYAMPFQEETSAFVWAHFLRRQAIQTVKNGMLQEAFAKE